MAVKSKRPAVRKVVKRAPAKRSVAVRNPGTPPGQKEYDGSSQSILENTYQSSDAAWIDAVNKRSTLNANTTVRKTKLKKYKGSRPRAR